MKGKRKSGLGAGYKREENENKISYGCGVAVGICTVSCQAADFSHGNGTLDMVTVH